MKLKKFILFTVILSSLFIGIGLFLDTPLAFIPQDASSFEYVVTKIVFAMALAIFILSIFVHVRNTVKMDREYKISKGV